jgi:DNA polymerase-3 subunit delta
MVAIAHREADRYVDQPDRAHSLFLVFGSDPGLIFERSRKLIRRSGDRTDEAPTVIDLSGDAIASDPLVLIDEANSIGLFDGPFRVLRVTLGSRSILPALEMLERAPTDQCAIILLGGELKRDAPLRKWAEKQNFAAAIECLSDDARGVQRLLDQELKQANIGIEPDARELLTQILGEDRLSTRAEIAKLLLYAKDQPTITVAHVNDILLDATALDLDDLLSAIFSGRADRFVDLTSKISIRDFDGNRLLGATVRYALAIHRARADLEHGASQNDALQTMLRLVNGFRRKAEVASELERARLERISEFLIAAYTTTKDIRKMNLLAEERFERLALAMARSIANNEKRKMR